MKLGTAIDPYQWLEQFPWQVPLSSVGAANVAKSFGAGKPSRRWSSDRWIIDDNGLPQLELTSNDSEAVHQHAAETLLAEVTHAWVAPSTIRKRLGPQWCAAFRLHPLDEECTIGLSLDGDRQHRPSNHGGAVIYRTSQAKAFTKWAKNHRLHSLVQRGKNLGVEQLLQFQKKNTTPIAHGIASSYGQQTVFLGLTAS